MGKETEITIIPTREHLGLSGVTSDQHHAQLHEAEHITGGDLLDLQTQSFENLLLNGDFEIGNPPINWVLIGAGATVIRSNAQVRIGAYSALLTRNGNNAELAGVIPDFTRYRNSYVTLGCWVYATVAFRARLRLYDGVTYSYSPYHSGSSTWEWLTITKLMAALTTTFQARLTIWTADTAAYFDGAMLVEGSLCPAFSPKPTEIAVETTEVFNGASPNPSAWTDLDLSAVVGANQALVFLKVYNPNGAAQHFNFRPNGEVEYASYLAYLFGVYNCSATDFGVACCLTDAAGLVEWIYAVAAQAGVTIDVIGFIR